MGLMPEAREDHISETNIKPIFYCHVGIPGHTCSTQKALVQDTQKIQQNTLNWWRLTSWMKGD